MLKAQAVIITASASQLGRMLIKLCIKEGIKPICTVRRSEQVALLKTDYGVEHVYNSTDADFDTQM